MKDRQIKTVLEKYGTHSVVAEFDKMIYNAKGMEDMKLFEKLPYVGILYIPYENDFSELIYDGEDGELFKDGREFKKFKVLEVGEDYWIVSHYDDHHHNIVKLRRRYDKFLVMGNELIINETFERNVRI